MHYQSGVAGAVYRRYEKLYRSLAVLEMFLDTQAWARKTAAWMRGLWRVGFDGAHKAAAGLAYD